MFSTRPQGLLEEGRVQACAILEQVRHQDLGKPQPVRGTQGQVLTLLWPRSHAAAEPMRVPAQLAYLRACTEADGCPSKGKAYFLGQSRIGGGMCNRWPEMGCDLGITEDKSEIASAS